MLLNKLPPLNIPPFSLKILYKCPRRISASLTPLLTEYTVYSMFIFSYHSAKYTEWPFFSVEFQRLGSADIFGDKTRLRRTIPNQECVPLIQRWKKRWKICSSFLVLILLQFFFVWKKRHMLSCGEDSKEWKKRPGRLFDWYLFCQL